MLIGVARTLERTWFKMDAAPPTLDRFYRWVSLRCKFESTRDSFHVLGEAEGVN